MRVFLAVVALVTVAGAASVSQEDLNFHAWKVKFGKSYGSAEEESLRKMTWLKSLKLVLEHNKLADQGIKSYRLGMNHLADMDNQEYQAQMGGFRQFFNTTKTRSETPSLPPVGGTALPASVDWRKNGSVTAVKNQMTCNSCWAFSATGALEGQMFRKTGKLVSLSEQQLLDCSKENHGCKGGWPAWAYEYIKVSGGLQSEDSYPYENKVEPCRFYADSAVATCHSSRYAANGNEKTLQEAVATIGPVSVVIDFSHDSFKLYETGVYDEPKCGKHANQLYHAVLVVGFGTEDTRDYWLVKNSWGVGWGEDGYIKMSRNKRNQCGIASEAVYPVV